MRKYPYFHQGEDALSKNFTFTPALCKPTPGKDGAPDVGAAYSGTLTIRRPTFEERLDLMDGASAFKVDGDEDKARSGIAYLRKMQPNVGKFFVAADIKRVDDGVAITDWASLCDDGVAAMGVVQEIAIKLLGDFRVGNDSRSS